MQLHHIALWTFRLEELKAFYTGYFHGTSNEKYVNPQKGFESYFISFASGASLELMRRTDIPNTPVEDNRIGLTHLAFEFPNQEEVLQFTEQMRAEGFTIAGEPRTSGDGYFESVILDPDGNRLECVYRKKEIEKEMVTAAELRTEHLLLRGFEERDVESVFACCRNPKLGDNAGWPPHETLKDSYDALHTVFMGQESVWAMVLKENGQLIGCIGLMDDPQRSNPQARMIGYWLDETYWGKGYMTEAVQAVITYGFRVLGASLITGTCYPRNERSASVLTRNGFTYEGTLHEATRDHNGDTLDLQCYYLTADHFSHC